MSGRRPNRGDSVSGDTPIEYAYGVLNQRVLMNNDVLWRIIAFTLAAEVSAYVGLFAVSNAQVTNVSFLHVLIGCAMAGMGIVGPLTTRFVETILLMDRQLLDAYEEQLLGPNSELTLLHAARMRTRVEAWDHRLDDEGRARLAERRFANIPLAKALNRLLDGIGQPSLIWTFIMGLGGAVGFDIGIYLNQGGATGWFWFWVILTNAFMLILWMLASGAMDSLFGRLRKSRAFGWVFRLRKKTEADWEITCVDRAHPHGHITSLGVTNPTTHTLERLSLAKVVDDIRQGSRRYVVTDGERAARVAVVRCSHDGCTEPALRTAADGTAANNLRSLGACQSESAESDQADFSRGDQGQVIA